MWTPLQSSPYSISIITDNQQCKFDFVEQSIDFLPVVSLSCISILVVFLWVCRCHHYTGTRCQQYYTSSTFQLQVTKNDTTQTWTEACIWRLLAPFRQPNVRSDCAEAAMGLLCNVALPECENGKPRSTVCSSSCDNVKTVSFLSLHTVIVVKLTCMSIRESPSAQVQARGISAQLYQTWNQKRNSTRQLLF